MISWFECQCIELEFSTDSGQILQDELGSLSLVDHAVGELDHLEFVHVLVQVWVLICKLLVFWVKRLG